MLQICKAEVIDNNFEVLKLTTNKLIIDYTRIYAEEKRKRHNGSNKLSQVS